MMDDEPRRKHVSHRILRLDVLGPDGHKQSAFRVFCRERGAPVPVETCRECRHCERVDEAPAPAVSCLVSAARADLADDPLGLVTPVAEVLTAQTYALERETTLADAIAHLREEDRRSVVVVDADRAIIGVIHEGHRAGRRELPVETVMSSRLSLHLATPVRRALELMAAAHLREIVVVDDERVPLGTFRDVDGLLWLAHRR